ncbi:MAG TPA: hypothetical protein VNF68_08215 [Candidatus Baltobacteraceae bacterium]|nr:hypothetical protein [Candidatus Baltobacteraceae bacterium]
MRNAFVFLALVALLASAARAADPTPAPPDIHIYSCKVMSGPTLVPQANEVGLAVRFQNDSTQEYKSILWRAKYGSGYVDFLDDGQFSPQIRIDNFLLFDIGKAHANILGVLFMPRGSSVPIDSQVHLAEYASMSDPENCSIVQATTDDDVTWKNPDAPAAHYLFPSPAPSTEATLAPGEDVAKGPIDIAHCHLLFPYVRNTAQLDVGFRSVAPGKTADAVTFRVSYGSGTLDAIDRGAFEDGTYVRHKLKIALPDELGGRSYFSLDDPANCAAVSVHYADGTQWNNPAAPSPLPVPTKVPDALDNGLGPWYVNWKQGLTLPAPSPTPSPTP